MHPIAVFMSLLLTFAAALPVASCADENIPASQKNTNTDYLQDSITRKQQKLASLETELGRIKRRSPRRQYTAAIESQISGVRYELFELQKFQ